nr:reverse transcriptase domain-containing protein [Tanacetum cinerariifolium]
MSTRSSARNIFPPLDNPELTIRRRSRVDPTLLNDFEKDTNRNDDPPVPDLQTMKELCQPTLNGRGGPITPIAIQATNFGLKNDMIQQINQQVKAVTPSCETCGGPHSYNDCQATVGQTQNVYAAGAYQGGNSYQPQGNRNLLSYRSDNYLRPPGFNENQNRNNQNQNFQNENKNQGNNHRIPQGNNQGRNQFFQVASHGQNPALAYQAPDYQALRYKAPVHQPLIPQPQVVTTTEFINYMKTNDAILENMQTNMTSLTNSNLELKNMFGQFMKMNTASSSGSETLPSNTVTNPKEDLKANRVDVNYMACEEYYQKVLGFFDVIASGNPTPYYDPIISTSSLTLTTFGDSDFLLEEVDAFLTLEDDSSSLEIKSFDGVFTARKPLTFSRLATMDPPGDTKGKISQRDEMPQNSIQTSGQVEVSNRGLNRILERIVGENCASWSDKLDDALWAFRTAFKTSIECTPYKLVYEKECHLSIELEHKAYWALKHANYNLLTAGDLRKVQLNKINELCHQAYENSLIYKEKTKRIHDSKIKDRVFNVGDRVLLFNSRLKIFSGKLKTCWSGPFSITQVFPYGTVELSQTNKPNFTVNGHRLKHYFGEDIPKMVVSDLQTFPKDQ